jgi:hypothetical protein
MLEEVRMRPEMEPGWMWESRCVWERVLLYIKAQGLHGTLSEK